MATTRHRSLVERDARKLLFVTMALHTHQKGESKKNDIHES